MQHSSRRSWGLIFFTALLTMAVLGALAYLALYTDPREARALRTPGTLIAVTRGTEPLVLGANWQKLLLRVFPQWQAAIGGRIRKAPAAASKNSLVVWQNLGDISFWSGPPPYFTGTLTDDRGEKLEVAVASQDWGIGSLTLVPFELSTFPRRGKQIRILAKDWSGSANLHSNLIVANPTPDDFPVWKGDSSTAKYSDGNLEVILRNAATRTSSDIFPSLQATLKLEIREGGRPVAKSWAIEKVRVEDPTGNIEEFPEPSFEATNERLTVTLSPFCLPTEPANRVTLEMARIANFPREEILMMGELRVPPKGQNLVPGRFGRLHGFKVELLEVNGPNTISKLGWSSSSPTAGVRVTGPVDRFCLRSSTTAGDSSGFDSTSETGTSGIFLVGVNAQESQRPVTLTLALTPRRKFTFMVPIARRSGSAAARR